MVSIISFIMSTSIFTSLVYDGCTSMIVLGGSSIISVRILIEQFDIAEIRYRLIPVDLLFSFFLFNSTFGIAWLYLVFSLMFGSLISAVDPVATLAILGSPELGVDPLLYRFSLSLSISLIYETTTHESCSMIFLLTVSSLGNLYWMMQWPLCFIGNKRTILADSQELTLFVLKLKNIRKFCWKRQSKLWSKHYTVNSLGCVTFSLSNFIYLNLLL